MPAPATDILNERARAPKEMPPDDIRGYDVRTGKHLWTFHVVPRKGEFGNETWLNDSWTYSGNSGAWSLISGDEELGYVYLPFENATGDYYGGTRPGTNLFSESIMCLDARTGKRVWHYQVVHHGLWDYDLPAAPVLADITVNGRRIKALAQVTKQAFVFVLDRTNGQPVWPIDERPVPKGNVPGEWYSPTQPIPIEAAGIRSAGRLREGPDRLHAGAEGRSAEDHQRVQGTARSTRRRSCSAVPTARRARSSCPGTNGGADWGGAAFDKETGILYVPSAHLPDILALGKSLHPESTLPFVKQTGAADDRAAGPARSVQAAVLAAGGDRSEQGRHPLVGRQRRRPAQSSRRSRGSNVPPLGNARPPRRARDQDVRLHGRGQRQRRRRAAAAAAARCSAPSTRRPARSCGRWSCPRGTSGAPMTYMAERQAVHRRRRLGPAVSR